MGFYQQLAAAAQRNDSLLCVGLDPRPERLFTGDSLFTFNRAIIDGTKDLVCAYKPNFAFYESAGPDGLADLQRTIAHIHATTNVPVILDGKRGDIGSTAAAYARAAFEVWGADALTVNPYLGHDSVSPFTSYPDRGVFLLCHTSNPGATDLQTLLSGGRPLYEIVAAKARGWGTGLVVGATYPGALVRVRALAPEAWILLPGVGAQGGDLEAALSAGLRPDGLGVIVNSSRGIIYAGNPRQVALDLREQINLARAAAPSHPISSPSKEEALTLALHDIGAIKFGTFTLASGKRSPIYIDLRLLASHPSVLGQVARAYAELIGELAPLPPGRHLCLAAIPYAALPIGAAVSLETGLPMIYPRKEAKDYGTTRQIEGEYQAGDRALVLDDLITTGGSKLAAISPLEEVGLEVQDIVVLIDRQQGGAQELDEAGYRLHSVLHLGQMLDILFDAGRISREQRDSVRALLG
jgi:uridine monophosphate synthetase